MGRFSSLPPFSDIRFKRLGVYVLPAACGFQNPSEELCQVASFRDCYFLGWFVCHVFPLATRIIDRLCQELNYSRLFTFLLSDNFLQFATSHEPVPKFKCGLGMPFDKLRANGLVKFLVSLPNHQASDTPILGWLLASPAARTSTNQIKEATRHILVASDFLL
jgi:hypothetical protein